MSSYQLPLRRVINKHFQEKGREDVYRIEAFPITDGEKLKLIFESANSFRRQGVWLNTDGYLLVNQEKSSSMEMWQDTAPNEVIIEVRAQSGFMMLYNIWENNQRKSSQGISSGMLIEELAKGRRYCCNDLGFDTDFTKLIFRIERI